MRVRLAPFRGMLPRRDPRFLELGQAREAKDVRLLSGALQAYRETKTVEDSLELSSGSVEAIARWRSGGEATWLRFPSPVDVVRGPVSGDVWERVYWTGDSRYGQPMYSWAGKIAGSEPPATAYKLGVPAPEQEISATPKDLPSGDVAEIHADERPIRVVTDSDHGLETGDIVRFSIEADEPDDNDEDDLADFINATDGFQVRVTGDREFTLDNTDGEVREYTAFQSGTWEVYIDPGLRERRFYVHTYVTELGEEGPPSPASSAVDAGPTQNVQLDLPSLDPEAGENRLIERRRIYRTATGDEGAEFQFVDEVDIADSEYTDSIATDNLAEALPSGAYDPPPEDLHSLNALPSGVMVGAVDQDVCFSEPYLPHAWPGEYRLTLDHPIVGVAVFDSYVVAATESRPYLITGEDPRAMQPTRLPVTQGCLSKRSIVSLGYAVLYASADGLVMVDSSGAQLVTRGIITPDEWSGYAPESIHAYEHEGRYIAFFDNGARRGAFVFDPREADAGVSELSIWARHGFRDPVEPKLYLLTEDGSVSQWDAGDDPMPYRWKSGVVPTPRPVSPSCIQVVAHSYEDTKITVHAGETATVTVTGDHIHRLPPMGRSRDIQIDVEGTDTVQEVAVADSVPELMQ